MFTFLSVGCYHNETSLRAKQMKLSFRAYIFEYDRIRLSLAFYNNIIDILYHGLDLDARLQQLSVCGMALASISIEK